MTNTTILTNFIDLPEIRQRIILEWRNHENVRNWMYTSQPITIQEHLAFIERLKVSDQKRYFLVQHSGEDYGVIYFTDINMHEKSALFGIYANPFCSSSGKGAILIEAGIRYAFDKAHLDILRLEVFSNNQRALKLYRHFKFKEAGTECIDGREIIFMELYQKKEFTND